MSLASFTPPPDFYSLKDHIFFILSLNLQFSAPALVSEGSWILDKGKIG